jgi:hypothetical protein
MEEFASSENSDDDFAKGLDPEDARDVADGLLGSLGVDDELEATAVADSHVSGDGRENSGDESAGSSDADAEVEALAMGPRPLPSVEDFVAHSHVGPLGYVTTTLAPLDRLPVIGRITSWPHSKPELLRSTSCKCKLHPGCSTPARSRRVADNDLLLRWLFAGEYLPEGSRAEKEAARRAHEAMFRDLVAAPVGQAKT